MLQQQISQMEGKFGVDMQGMMTQLKDLQSKTNLLGERKTQQ